MMDEFALDLANLLSHKVVVHICSYPPFSMEIIFGLALCFVQLILIFDVNEIYKEACSNMKKKKWLLENGGELSESNHTIFSHDFNEDSKRKRRTRCLSLLNDEQKKSLSKSLLDFSKTTNLGNSATLVQRIEYLLKISPSEYVRKDLENKHREQALKYFNSLTSLFEESVVKNKSEKETEMDLAAFEDLVDKTLALLKKRKSKCQINPSLEQIMNGNMGKSNDIKKMIEEIESEDVVTVIDSNKSKDEFYTSESNESLESNE